MELFDKVIKGLEGERKIGEILDFDKDVIQLSNGNYVIRKVGIQKLADFVGAYWRKPEVIDTPNINNLKGFYVISECVFPDGSVNSAVGESNEKTIK